MAARFGQREVTKVEPYLSLLCRLESLQPCPIWIPSLMTETYRSAMSEQLLPNALLVEDEPQIRRFVRTSLEAEGWRVFEAETMKRGLIDAASRKPDLIV